VRKSIKILVRGPERNRPLVRFQHRWEDNIEMDLRDVEWEVVDWVHMA
jgi:hypothetical protein